VLIPPVHQVLRRMPGDEPARWLRVHRPLQPRAPRAEVGPEAFRVRVEDGGEALGSIWALRERRDGEPDGTETRLLAASADQIGQALAHDRLEAEAQAAAIARESDALKSALLQSVSHDLRTPLATIRAAAGTLRPGSPLSDADRAESADAIDREVEYLDRLVTNLLDLSRIEAGVLRAERDVFDLEDLVGRTIDRLRRRIAGRSLEVSLAAPPVEVDPVFVDEAVTNILENAVKYTPPDARIRVVADLIGDGPFVRLTIEDAGPGVPEETLPRLFDKFYRVPGSPRGSRSGTGIGLAVARGLVEATGGAVAARRSDLGGLAIDVDLPVAAVPAELGGTRGA
jgi:two-component system sensor histidine kinase KdpD